MNRCTIFEFRNAIAMPYKLLAELRNANIDFTSLTRTRYFAECQATINNDKILIYAPLEQLSIQLVYSANESLQRAYRDGLTRLEVLDNEMQHTSIDSANANNGERCPLVIEPLPDGCPLLDAMNTMSRERLLNALAELDNMLRRYDISHNNLTPNNIIVDDMGHWHPIRKYYTCRGYGGDERALGELRRLIYEFTTPMEEVDISELDPWRGRNINNSNCLMESRRQYRTSEGIGFEDEFGKSVIAPQYIWASEFLENRAVVRNSENRVGVIDRDGKEIIPIIYDSVEYSVDSGRSNVGCNGLTSIFDYNGTQLTEWQEIPSDNRQRSATEQREIDYREI